MADAHKDSGNVFFKGGDYTGALREYTKGLEIDPTHAVLYLNRAACRLALEDFQAAVSDCKKSLEFAKTAKAYMRLSRAYRSLGNIDASVTALETAVAMEPHNVAAVDELGELRRARASASAGASTAGAAAGGGGGGGGSATLIRFTFQTDLLILLLGVIQLPFLLLWPSVASLLWSAQIAGMAARQVIGIMRGAVAPSLSLTYVKHLFTSMIGNFSGQYLLLCAFLLFSGVMPQMLLSIIIALYAAMDIIVYFRADLFKILASHPMLQKLKDAYANHYIELLARRQEEMFMQIAVLEVTYGIMAIVSGMSLMGTLIYWQFLKQRYRSDIRYSRRAFGELHRQIRGFLTSKTWIPAVLPSFFDKFASFLNKLAQ